MHDEDEAPDPFEPSDDTIADRNLVKKFNAWIATSFGPILDEAREAEARGMNQGALLAFRSFEAGYKLGLKE